MISVEKCDEGDSAGDGGRCGRLSLLQERLAHRRLGVRLGSGMAKGGLGATPAADSLCAGR